MPNNRDWLDDVLGRARVPQKSEEYWKKLPDKVIRRLVEKLQAPFDRTEPHHNWWRNSGMWGVAFATACLVFGFILGHLNGRRNALPPEELARNRKVFDEIAALFPNRLQSISIDEKGVQLSLSEQPSLPGSTPLVIEICKAGHCRTFITFSGQRIRSDGESFEVLLGADNKVILVGDDLVWSNTDKPSNGELHITARQLSETL